jgi:plasmid stabilization system protein ParE
MANLTLRFALSARADLNEILSFIAMDNPNAAAKLATKVEKGLSRLVEFPDSGRLVPEEPTSRAREVVVPPLRIFYRVEGDVVRILHVMRGEHSFPPLGW